MKKIYSAGLVGMLAVFGLITVFAPVSYGIAKADVSATAAVTLLSLQDKGGKKIDDMISTLNDWKAKIFKRKKISLSLRTSLVGEIDAEIALLNAHKALIYGATDETAVKTLLKAIDTDFRIYTVFIPKISLKFGIYFEDHLVRSARNSLSRHKKEIAALKAKGIDTTDKEEDLADAKEIFNALPKKIEDLLAMIDGVQPSDYPVDNKTTFAQVSLDNKEVKSDLKEIFDVLNDK